LTMNTENCGAMYMLSPFQNKSLASCSIYAYPEREIARPKAFPYYHRKDRTIQLQSSF